jgi:hypothetical protein
VKAALRANAVLRVQAERLIAAYVTPESAILQMFHKLGEIVALNSPVTKSRFFSFASGLQRR